MGRKKKDRAFQKYQVKVWNHVLPAIDSLSKRLCLDKEMLLGIATREMLARLEAGKDSEVYADYAGHKRQGNTKPCRVLLSPAEKASLDRECGKLKINISVVVSLAAWTYASMWITTLANEGVVILKLDLDTISSIHEKLTGKALPGNNPTVNKEVRIAMTKLINETKGKCLDWGEDG